MTFTWAGLFGASRVALLAAAALAAAAALSAGAGAGALVGAAPAVPALAAASEPRPLAAKTADADGRGTKLAPGLDHEGGPAAVVKAGRGLSASTVAGADSAGRTARVALGTTGSVAGGARTLPCSIAGRAMGGLAAVAVTVAGGLFDRDPIAKLSPAKSSTTAA